MAQMRASWSILNETWQLNHEIKLSHPKRIIMVSQDGFLKIVKSSKNYENDTTMVSGGEVASNDDIEPKKKCSLFFSIDEAEKSHL